MGETRIHFKIYGTNGEVADLEAVVDTGTTFSKIPGSVAARLELEAKYETEVELGDGRVIGRRLTLAEVEIEEVRRPVLVAIGEEEKPLIGYTTLELLGFKVNPITGKLERAMPIEYRNEGEIMVSATRISNSESSCMGGLLTLFGRIKKGRRFKGASEVYQGIKNCKR